MSLDNFYAAPLSGRKSIEMPSTAFMNRKMSLAAEQLPGHFSNQFEIEAPKGDDDSMNFEDEQASMAQLDEEWR